MGRSMLIVRMTTSSPRAAAFSLNARVCIAQTFVSTEGTTDIAALLQHGPVMLDGAKSAEQAAPTPWLLAIKMTADGKGIIANDPLTGDQVVLAYDSATKTVGGVTAVIDPKTGKPVPLGNGAPTLTGQKTKVPDSAWPELKGFTPTSYFAVSI